MLGTQKQEDQKLVVILSYMVSLKTAGDIYEVLSQTERGGKEGKENKMKRMRNLHTMKRMDILWAKTSIGNIQKEHLQSQRLERHSNQMLYFRHLEKM